MKDSYLFKINTLQELIRRKACLRGLNLCCYHVYLRIIIYCGNRKKNLDKGSVGATMAAIYDAVVL